MSVNTEKNIVIDTIMSESDLESQSSNESGMLTVGEPGAITETAVGNIIVHSTPIAYQTQANETSVDSGIQLTPVSTNKNKQAEETDMMSIMPVSYTHLDVYKRQIQHCHYNFRLYYSYSVQFLNRCV